MKALLIVDIQNDFVPGGALAVPEGDQIIPRINLLMQLDFDLIVASKDWHPADHGSFAQTYDKKVGEHILLEGIDQILWPVHCVQNTHGADFVPSLDTECIDVTIYKGTDSKIDSYSVFFDNKHLKSTGLEQILREKKITTVYIAGLTTDYCVKFSALDAIQLGFETYVVQDVCRGINLMQQDTEEALEEIRLAGARIVESQSLMDAFK